MRRGQDLRCPGSWSAPAGQVSLPTRRPHPGLPGLRVRRTEAPGSAAVIRSRSRRCTPGKVATASPTGSALHCPGTASTETPKTRVSSAAGACACVRVCVPLCVCMCASPHVLVYVDVCAHQGNCMRAWSWVSACFRELTVCAKLRVCAGQVPWGRRVVYVCTCVTETVHMKFGEGHAYVSGYLGGNGRAGATILGGRTVGSGWLWRTVKCVGSELWECKNCKYVCFHVRSNDGCFWGLPREEVGTKESLEVLIALGGVSAVVWGSG